MRKKSTSFHADRRSEIAGILLLGLTVLLFLALVTDGYDGQAQDARPFNLSEPNLLSVPGAVLAWTFAMLVGDAAHVFYVLTFVWSMMLLTHRPVDRLLTRMVGMVVLLGACAGLLQIDRAAGWSNPLQPGGAFGAFIADSLLVPNFGVVGSNVIGLTVAMVGILLATDFLLIHGVLLTQRFLRHLIRGNLAIFEGARYYWDEYLRPTPKAKTAEIAERVAKRRAKAAPATDEEVLTEEKEDNLERMKIRKPGQELEPSEQEELSFEEAVEAVAELDESPFEDPVGAEAGDAPVEVDAEIVDAIPVPELELEPVAEAPKQRRLVRKPKISNDVADDLPDDYVYPKRYKKPTLEMLKYGTTVEIPNLDQHLRETGLILEETLDQHGIDAKVTDVTRGPTITRFELEPAPGIKVSRFLALADDIALALKAHRIRVEAPIPGKGRVGIEAPNAERDSVVLRELLEFPAFKKSKGQLDLVLGKDIEGNASFADLATMPHLLVAGATGAGKTVCVKSLLASLLFNKTPDDLQLILIDPKMVELSIFNDIPHLITPVVTDPKKAATALTWLIKEMEERYKLFADLRVRNIEVYNESVDNGEIEVEGLEEDDEGQALSVVRKLPYIVCVIDELADLMMLARAEVEDAIARLAQLARAVGIHMVIATQRPSVDVLTGVIKANFPARISFQVSSRVDSRCILDEIGAERLIGMGDLLYLPAGQSKPQRIQGAFVSDEEMFELIAYLKTQAPPQYKDEIENYGKSKGKDSEILEEDDPLLDEAVQIVLETGQASISMVQRKLRVGYTRAARLIDMMEVKGIVGPHEGSKAREILVNSAHKDDVA